MDTDRQRLAFGLVHGGMHGAWCWERVAKELEGRGHIVCERDHAVNPVWGRVAAERRLGVRPVELAHTGHAPFIDRPDELAELFVRLGSE